MIFDTHNRSYRQPRQPMRLTHWLQGIAFAAALLFVQGYLDGRDEQRAAEAKAQASDVRALSVALAQCIAGWPDSDERPATVYPMTQEGI